MSERDVLWNLPLCRGLAYMHAAMIMNGNEMIWSKESEEDETMKKAMEMIRDKPWRN